MARKNRIGVPKYEIPRLIQLAFSKARAGEIAEAKSAWKSAAKYGYVPCEKTERNLFRIIDKWESEAKG